MSGHSAEKDAGPPLCLDCGVWIGDLEPWGIEYCEQCAGVPQASVFPPGESDGGAA